MPEVAFFNWPARSSDRDLLIHQAISLLAMNTYNVASRIKLLSVAVAMLNDILHDNIQYAQANKSK